MAGDGVQITLSVRDDGSATIKKIAGDFQQLSQQSVSGAQAIEQAFSNVKSALAGLGAGFGVGALVEFMRSAVDRAVEVERAFSQLKFAVESVTDEGFDRFNLVVERTIKNVSDMAVVTKEQAAKGLQVLTLNTGDLAGSTKNLALVFDLAAAKGLSVEQAAKFVSLAMTGNLQALGRLLPEFRGINKEFDATTTMAEKAAYGLDLLHKKLDGAAQAMSDQTKQVLEGKKAWDEFGKTIDEKALGAFGKIATYFKAMLLIPQVAAGALAPVLPEAKTGSAAMTDAQRSQQTHLNNLQQLKAIGDEIEAGHARRAAAALQALEIQKRAVETLKGSLEPVKTQLQELEQHASKLAAEQEKLAKTRESITEQAQVSLRDALKPLAPGQEQGQPLETQVTQALATFKDLVDQAGGESGAVRDATVGELKKMVPQVRDLLSQAYSPDFVKRQVTDMIAEITKLQKDVVDKAAAQITVQQGQVTAAIQTFSTLADGAAGAMAKVADKLKRSIADATDDGKKRIDDFLNTVAKDASAIYQLIARAAAAIPPGTGTDTQAAIGQSIVDSARGTGEQGGFVSTFDTAGIPAFASGGIVTRPTIALVGENGPERITPLGQGGGNTININVYSTNADPRQVAKAIRPHLLALGKMA